VTRARSAAVVVAPDPVQRPALQPPPRSPGSEVARKDQATVVTPPSRLNAPVQSPLEPMREQRVSVRIGTIEIRATEQARPAEVPPALPAASPLAPLGFEGYAPLRAYAPWMR
jgi:hypothetical protein